MIEKIKELLYGEGLCNMNIRAVYNSELHDGKMLKYFEETVIPAGKRKGYLGNFILTDRLHLVKGRKKGLMGITAEIDLNLPSNREGIRELDILDYVCPTDDQGYANPEYDSEAKPKADEKCHPPHIDFNVDGVRYSARFEKSLLGKRLDKIPSSLVGFFRSAHAHA